MLINVPAGADANGNAHGRKIGYPFWDVNDPQVLKTAQYFDTANCAARIKVPSLVSMGFIDTATPPVGIWAAFNQIKGPKEAAPMIDSPHNHLATPEQSLPWTQRSAAWLSALVAGRPPFEPSDVATPRTDANSKLAHEQLLAKRKAGQIDVYFMGDSITRRWGASDAAVPGPARQLAREFSWLERRGLRLGRRQDAAHVVAAAERRARRRQSEDRRADGRH